jgi:ATP-dependent DNA ligase
MFVRSSLDFDVTPRGSVEQAAAEADAAAIDGFVAVDLLRIDGASLLDVPLLERKRLLESVIAPGPLLRLSPHVRPPIDPWIATWKSMGLRGGIMKAANSRYHPLDDTVEWRIVERLNRRR